MGKRVADRDQTPVTPGEFWGADPGDPAEPGIVNTGSIAVYGWLAGLSAAARSRAKTRFWLSVLTDAIRANHVMCRAGFEETDQPC